MMDDFDKVIRYYVWAVVLGVVVATVLGAAIVGGTALLIVSALSG